MPPLLLPHHAHASTARSFARASSPSSSPSLTVNVGPSSNSGNGAGLLERRQKEGMVVNPGTSSGAGRRGSFHGGSVGRRDPSPFRSSSPFASSAAAAGEPYGLGLGINIPAPTSTRTMASSPYSTSTSTTTPNTMTNPRSYTHPQSSHRHPVHRSPLHYPLPRASSTAPPISPAALSRARDASPFASSPSPAAKRHSLVLPLDMRFEDEAGWSSDFSDNGGGSAGDKRKSWGVEGFLEEGDRNNPLMRLQSRAQACGRRGSDAANRGQQPVVGSASAFGREEDLWNVGGGGGGGGVRLYGEDGLGAVGWEAMEVQERERLLRKRRSGALLLDRSRVLGGMTSTPEMRKSAVAPGVTVINATASPPSSPEARRAPLLHRHPAPPSPGPTPTPSLSSASLISSSPIHRQQPTPVTVRANRRMSLPVPPSSDPTHGRRISTSPRDRSSTTALWDTRRPAWQMKRAVTEGVEGLERAITDEDLAYMMMSEAERVRADAIRAWSRAAAHRASGGGGGGGSGGGDASGSGSSAGSVKVPSILSITFKFQPNGSIASTCRPSLLALQTYFNNPRSPRLSSRGGAGGTQVKLTNQFIGNEMGRGKGASVLVEWTTGMRNELQISERMGSDEIVDWVRRL